MIGDFGCGDAKLAASVKNVVHSFDLVSRNERVIAADIAHVPLERESLDIAVYSLALMGTNMMDYIREGYRVLKINGIMKVRTCMFRACMPQPIAILNLLPGCHCLRRLLRSRVVLRWMDWKE